MRGSLRDIKMLKVSFRSTIVIADNGVLWVGDNLKRIRKAND